MRYVRLQTKCIQLLPMWLAGLLLIACSTDFLPPNQTPESVNAESTAHIIHWEYDGEGGPEHWAELDPAFATCGMGREQSPIDLRSTEAQNLENIAFHYAPSNVNILHNGHTVLVNYDPGSYIEVDDQRYDVAQFHFHTPSEHTINGRFYDAELHIVHLNTEGRLAVVGILLEQGSDNAAYHSLLSVLPPSESEEVDAGIAINAADLLPDTQATYRYDGSLTTPPCSEGVEWYVMTDPDQVSAEQLRALKAAVNDNNRPVQALNDRSPVEDSTP